MGAPKAMIPEPLASDSSELSDALGVARALWAKGATEDAIRWVRRAVDAADEAGDASRVAGLARAAAELADLRSSRPSPPPAPASQVRLTSRSAPPPFPPRSTRPPPVPSRPPRSATTHAMRPPPVDVSAQALQTRIRVSVRTSVRDEGLLVVRPLPEGKAPPPGTREAYLVMADADEAESEIVTDGEIVG